MSLPSRLAGRRILVVATFVAAVVCILVVVVWNAPANWLARDVATRTGGVVLLADADGSIWSGSAVLAFGPPDTAAPGVQSGAPVALPGRIRWRLGWAGMLAPVLHLSHDGVLSQPLTVRYAAGGLAADAGAASLPVALVDVAGPPFNTLLPDGRCELRWGPLQFGRDGNVTGEGAMRIVGLTLNVSPVRPLGTYLVSWSGDATGLAWQLATETGPLELKGNGTWRDRHGTARVVVRVSRDAPPPVAAQLGPLLDVIGRRGPDEAVIESERS